MKNHTNIANMLFENTKLISTVSELNTLLDNLKKN